MELHGFASAYGEVEKEANAGHALACEHHTQGMEIAATPLLTMSCMPRSRPTELYTQFGNEQVMKDGS